MNKSERAEALKKYPFYADQALEDYDRDVLKLDPSPEEVEQTIAKMADTLTERQIFFMQRLIWYAEACQTKRLAGLLHGMTPKARAKWIEEQAS